MRLPKKAKNPNNKHVKNIKICFRVENRDKRYLLKTLKEDKYLRI